MQFGFRVHHSTESANCYFANEMHPAKKPKMATLTPKWSLWKRTNWKPCLLLRILLRPLRDVTVALGAGRADDVTHPDAGPPPFFFCALVYMLPSSAHSTRLRGKFLRMCKTLGLLSARRGSIFRLCANFLAAYLSRPCKTWCADSLPWNMEMSLLQHGIL